MSTNGPEHPGAPAFGVATHEPTGWSFLAVLEGVLAVHDGWLYLTHGDLRVLSVFPEGSVSVEPGILVFRDRRLEIGSSCTFGGGHTDLRRTALVRGPDWAGTRSVALVGS